MRLLVIWHLWAVVVVLSVMLLTPFVSVAVLGPRLWRGIPEWVERERERARYMESLRPYGVAPDSTITAEEAGQAWHSMVWVSTAWSRYDRDSSTHLPQRPPARELPAWNGSIDWDSATEYTYLGEDWNDRRLDFYPRNGRSGLIFDWAVQGFMPSEEAYIEEIAAHPALDEYARIARALDMDYWGARYVLPSPGDAASLDEWGWFDWDRWWWSSHSAGLNLSFSPATATLLEVALRVPHARGFWHARAGAKRLEWLYELMGRERDARLLGAQHDSVEARLDRHTARRESLGVPRGSLDETRLALVAAIRDTTLSLRTRWGLASVLSLAPCTNLRELLFGPSMETRAAIEQARQALGRFPSDEAVFELMRLSLQSDAQPEPYTRHFVRFVRMSTRVSGWVLGSRPIRGCMYHLSYELTW
jgi:hypothetical protein